MSFLKSLVCVSVALALAFALLGCAQEDGARQAPGQQQGVADVLQAQTQSQAADDEPNSPASFVGSSEVRYADADVDIDLTEMGSDMVYATVYDMMSNADAYVGKVVRMSGPFYRVYDEETKNNYYFVVIKDATACCAQGIEFVWDDGSHAYPDEYPAEKTDVQVTGRFETYNEGTWKYVHLVDATLTAN